MYHQEVEEVVHLVIDLDKGMTEHREAVEVVLPVTDLALDMKVQREEAEVELTNLALGLMVEKERTEEVWEEEEEAALVLPIDQLPEILIQETTLHLQEV